MTRQEEAAKVVANLTEALELNRDYIFIRPSRVSGILAAVSALEARIKNGEFAQQVKERQVA